MNNIQLYQFAFFYLVILVLSIGCRKNTSTLDTSTIKEIRDLPEGIKVKVQATVTVPSDRFQSSLPKGFGIQDGTSGIYIVDTMGNYEINDSVEIIGIITTEQYSELKVIELTSIRKIGKSSPIEPLVVSTSQINKSNEGLLISTKGIIDSLHNDGQYGYKIYVNDGSGSINVFIHHDTGILADSSSWAKGQTVETTGFVAHFGHNYECAPRDTTDIKIMNSE